MTKPKAGLNKMAPICSPCSQDYLNLAADIDDATKRVGGMTAYRVHLNA
jgi:hypothetical protein